MPADESPFNSGGRAVTARVVGRGRMPPPRVDDEPPFNSDPHGTEWSRRALANDRLIRAALSLNEAFELRRVFEDSPPAREFVLACQVVRDLERNGKWESDAD